MCPRRQRRCRRADAPLFRPNALLSNRKSHHVPRPRAVRRPRRALGSVRVPRRRRITEPFPIQSAVIPDALAGRDVAGRAPTGSGKTLAFGLPARRSAASGAAAPAHRARARPDPRAGRADHQRAPPVRAPAPPRRRVRVRRRGLRPAAQGPRRRRRARRGLPRPARGPDPVRSRVTRRRGLRSSSTRPIAWPTWASSPPCGASSSRPTTPARCCCSPPRSTVRCPSSPATSSATPSIHEIGPQGPDISAARHVFWRVDRTERAAATADAIKAMGSTIVFCRTRHGADRLTKQLDKLGVTATPIHGGRSQPQRDRALRAFARGEVRSLIATDVAARGVHVDGVAGVVHFDPPQDATTYVHRSGRTARAGATGVVVSLVERSATHSARRLQREVGIDADISPVDLDAINETPPPCARAGRAGPRPGRRQVLQRWSRLWLHRPRHWRRPVRPPLEPARGRVAADRRQRGIRGPPGPQGRRGARRHARLTAVDGATDVAIAKTSSARSSACKRLSCRPSWTRAANRSGPRWSRAWRCISSLRN